MSLMRALVCLSLLGGAAATTDLKQYSTASAESPVDPPADDDLTVSDCATDYDCQLFGNSNATCIAGGCNCHSATDSTPHCWGAGNSNVTLDVTFVWSFAAQCEMFFTYTALMMRFKSAIEGAAKDKGTEMDVTFSCGSVNVVARGYAVLDQVRSLGQHLTDELDRVAVGTVMDGRRQSAITQLKGASSIYCGLPRHPDMSLVYFGPNNCVAASCDVGYDLVTLAPDYRAYCVGTTPAPPGPMDDMSAGGIAATAIGVLFVLLMCAALAFVLVTEYRARRRFEEDEEHLKKDCFEAPPGGSVMLHYEAEVQAAEESAHDQEGSTVFPNDVSEVFNKSPSDVHL